MFPSRKAPTMVLLASALAAACSEPPRPAGPRWVALAEHYRPRPLAELAERLEARLPARAGRVALRGPASDEPWFELPLPRSLWRRDERSGTWRAGMPAGGALLVSDPTSLGLYEPDREWSKCRPSDHKPGHFAVIGAELVLYLKPGVEPPEALSCRLRLDAGRAYGGRWHAAQQDLACDGFLVFPGLSEMLTLEIPPASCLSFATVSPDPDGRGVALGPTTFRVRLDGRLILEHFQHFARPVRSTWHRVELDTSGPHQLAFEIEGPVPALIATPILQPSEVGRPGARPWSDSRPDLVLVVCDTFRADNLAAWGGEPELAPHLNRLVERSVRFLDARAVACWTLPSIASILSGVYPSQHGATGGDRGVLQEVETIAEILARAGYRTAAVTDSGYFSRHFGQSQGFEWFEEVPVRKWNLDDTLARVRARLGADDGRALFLVVHTYRVHGPMRVGPNEDRQPPSASRAELRRQLEQRIANGEEVDRRKLTLEYAASQGQLYYKDAVRDLDRKVGAWLQELERDGFFERGNLILTADHGNARGEHGEIGHGGMMYEVKLRVPLAVAGRGIAPRAISGPSSLIDVAPTLAALAGVEPSATWPGRSLLERAQTGPIYAFQQGRHSESVAAYTGHRKLMAEDIQFLRHGRLTHAFDLERDPAEEHNLAGEPGGHAELGRSLADALEPLLVPLGKARELELSDEVLEELREIGYGR